MQDKVRTDASEDRFMGWVDTGVGFRCSPGFFQRLSDHNFRIARQNEAARAADAAAW